MQGTASSKEMVCINRGIPLFLKNGPHQLAVVYIIIIWQIFKNKDKILIHLKVINHKLDKKNLQFWSWLGANLKECNWEQRKNYKHKSYEASIYQAYQETFLHPKQSKIKLICWVAFSGLDFHQQHIVINNTFLWPRFKTEWHLI